MSGAYQACCIENSAQSAQSRSMNTSWKTLVIAAMGSLCLTAAEETQDRALTVVVFDYAGLSDSSLNEVEGLSALLLSRAGIRTDWVHCLGHQSGPRPALCDGNLETGSVLIRILAAHPAGNPNKLGDPLGSAVVANSFASLYVAEARKYAEHSGVPVASLLAYAATHEIGHLLLGESHAPTGIMRAAWGKTEYREMAQRWLGFNAAEREALRQTLPEVGATVATKK